MKLRIAVVTAGLLLAGALVFALWPTAERGEFTQVLSTRRADALGAKALFEVLAQSGHEPVRRTEDLESIEERGVLFSLQPEAEKSQLAQLLKLHVFGKFERREVLRWLDAGGRLVLVSDQNTLLHSELGVRITDGRSSSVSGGEIEEAIEGLAGLLGKKRPARPASAPRPRAPRPTGTQTAEASENAPFAFGARRLVAPRFSHFDVPATDPRTVFRHDGKAVVVAVPRGKGVAVLVSTPFVASNVGLPAGDSIRFFHGLATVLAGAGKIFFDEYHHGHRKARGFLALASAYRLHFAIAQVLFIAGLAIWAARRPRRERLAARDVARGAGEQMAAMATLYERGGLAPYAVTQLWNATLGALAARLRLRTRTVRSVSGALLARGHADAAVRLRSLEERHSGFGRKVRERDLVAFACALAELRMEIDPRKEAPR